MHSSELFKLFKLTQPCNFRKIHGFTWNRSMLGCILQQDRQSSSSLAAVQSVSSPVSLRRERMTCRVQLKYLHYIEEVQAIILQIIASTFRPGGGTQDDDSLLTLCITKSSWKKWHADQQGVSLQEQSFNKLLEQSLLIITWVMIKR